MTEYRSFRTSWLTERSYPDAVTYRPADTLIARDAYLQLVMTFWPARSATASAPANSMVGSIRLLHGSSLQCL